MNLVIEKIIEVSNSSHSPIIMDSSSLATTPTPTKPFEKDVRFDWSICDLTSTAEVLMNPKKSLIVGGSITFNKTFIEGRHYFGKNHQEHFVSLRASSRMNIGCAVGTRYENYFEGICGITSRVGFMLINQVLSLLR